MSVFTPPIVLENPPVLPETRGIERRLFRYLGAQPVGQSVVKVNGVFTVVPTPDQLLLEGLVDGVDYFLGGHEYVVTGALATALAAAGYTISTEGLATEGGDLIVAETGITITLEVT